MACSKTAAEFGDIWVKRMRPYRVLAAANPKTVVAALTALRDVENAFVVSLSTSHPWWQPKFDDAAFVNGLLRYGCGPDALNAMWEDAALPFAKRKEVNWTSLSKHSCSCDCA